MHRVRNIGIIGNSGTGKSSFINAVRGLPDYDDLAAPVGVTETTTTPTCYFHPKNSSICLWDLPGIECRHFSSGFEDYCAKVDWEKYDLLLIIAAKRFTENDRRLANMVQLLRKRLLFVRTKIDSDLLAEWRKRSFNPDKVLAEIRDDCAKNLTDIAPIDNIYLISSVHSSQWDFTRLTNDILI